MENETITFWACDPEINNKCPIRFRKEFCQDGGYCQLCDGTFDQVYARRHEDGTPISNKEWHEMKKKEKERNQICTGI